MFRPCRARLVLGQLGPQRRRPRRLGDGFQACRVLGHVLLAGADDGRGLAVRRQATDFRRSVARAFGRTVAIGGVAGQGQAGLPARHGQVDVRQNLGVEQGAVQFTAGVVDAIAFAQGVEAVALARVALTGHHQGVEDRAVTGDVRPIRLAHQREFVVDETHVERRVVDDQLRAVDELEKLIGNFRKARLAHQEFVGDAVHANGAFVTFPVRLQVHVEMPAGKAAAHQLDTADFNDPVTIGHRHAGGFGIEYNGSWWIYFVNHGSFLAAIPNENSIISTKNIQEM